MSEVGVVITPAAKADLPTLARIYYDVRLATMTWVDPSMYRETDFTLHSEGEDILVAKSIDDDILGFLSVWPADDFIHMLYVKLSWQGRGVGTRLLQSLPDWPNRRFRLKCLVRNVHAKAFYEGHGFQVIGGGTSDEGAYEEMAITDRKQQSPADAGL